MDSVNEGKEADEAGGVGFRSVGNVHFLVRWFILQLLVMGRLWQFLVASGEFTLQCLLQW